MRREQVLESPLKLDAGAGRILHAKAAELGAHTGLHHADAFGVSLPRRHAEVGPDLRQIGFLHAQQIDALAAGNLHHRHVVFFCDVGDSAQFVRRSDAATNARNHGERSVFLNIRVDAVVDEARRAVFLVIAAPQHVQHVAQRGLADFAAEAIAVDIENFLNGFELLAAQNLAQFVLRERQALAETFFVSSSNSGATAFSNSGNARYNFRNRSRRECIPSAAPSC